MRRRYGDVGHALLLFMFSAALVIWEKPLGKRKLNELVGMAFAGRYMLLLMGFFSIYCGIVYNDMFSLPLQLFESRWAFGPDNNGTAVRTGELHGAAGRVPRQLLPSLPAPACPCCPGVCTEWCCRC